MNAGWYFYELVQGQKIREAMQEEFFSADVIHGAAEALVREGIQNSLDAAISKQRVRVSITVGELTTESDRRAIVPFLRDSWDHFAAPDNGLKQPPTKDEPCRFMTFEDFGTSGLTGEPAQYLPKPDVENRFFHFFRVEGRSDKGEDDRGRWGVGKQVFPKASRAKCVFGYTIRHDDQRPLLMAQAILRAHYVGNRCYQDGWFGIKDEGKGVLPVEDRANQERFCNTFGLVRKDEPGLSLVIPFLHDEIVAEEVITAVLRGYFLPILTGELEVTVKAGKDTVHLTADTFEEQVDGLNSSIRDEVKPLVTIAKWARDNRDDIPELVAPPLDGALQWSEELVSEQIRGLVREKLQKRDKIGLRVPLMVRPRGTRGKPQRPSHFDVFFARDDKDTVGRPIYIREGIIVSDVRGPRARGIRSMVVVDLGPLATLLGDSENPSHTQWQKDGSNFKEKYYYGPSYIKFVADSVAEIVRISTQAEDEEDKFLLADIFSLPPSDDDEWVDQEEEETSTKKGKKIEIPKPPGSSRTRFIVHRVEGGFTVRPATALSSIPTRVRVRAAYDVRRGNAFSKYNTADFTFDELSVEIEGARILSTQANALVLEAEVQEFQATIKGFDSNRDVRVSVNVVHE